MTKNIIFVFAGIFMILLLIALPEGVILSVSAWLNGFFYLHPEPTSTQKIIAVAGVFPLVVGLWRLVSLTADDQMRTAEVSGKEFAEWAVLLLFLAAMNLFVCGLRTWDGLLLTITGEKPLAFLITILDGLLLLFVSLVNRERFTLTVEDTGRGGPIEIGRILIAGAVGLGLGLLLTPFAAPAIGDVNEVLYLLIARPLIFSGLVYFSFGYTYYMFSAMTNKKAGSVAAALAFALLSSPVWWWHIALNFIIGLLLVHVRDRLRNPLVLWIGLSMASMIPGLLREVNRTVAYVIVIPLALIAVAAMELYFRKNRESD